MKKAKLLKDVLDVFLLLGAFVCFVLLIASPFNLLELKLAGNRYGNLGNVPWYVWGEVLVSMIAYLYFLRGILFLRKASRFMNSKSFFKNELHNYLKKAGVAFLSCSGLLLLTSILSWLFFTIYRSITSLGMSEETIFIFVLGIFGLFLMIQSDFIKRAMQLKEENDLTI